MDRSEVERLLEQHRASFAARDAARIALDHAPDGTFESPAHGLVKGREKIEEVYRYWFTAFPDMHFEWETPLIDGPRAAFSWRLAGTLSGPFFGEVRPGTRLEIVGAAEYAFGAEGIVSARHVFDFSGALVRAGALKVKPS
jgi:hypothetical protein